ncbi:MAG: hypothetical protein JW934_14380, partial [Anaerolineae bacterium]|nr:hypothetical protein [Anaerolineae bacterium]
RLWYQFQAKKERWRLEQTAQRLNSQPTLTGYHQSLVDLLTFHLRQQRYRPKTVLAADLLSDQGQPGRARKGIRAPFESTGQRCRAVADETLYHLVSWIAQRLEEGLPAPAIVQTLLA